MLQSDAQEDLRLSIGAQAKEMPPPMLRDRANTFNTKQDSRQQEPAPVFDGPETELLSQLEKSRQEYEQLRCEKDKLERVQQQQHLHTTIEMRESIELLNEESLIKNEMLGKYEKEHQKLTDETKFYKDQNSELMGRLDEYERMVHSQNSSSQEISDFTGESQRNSVNIIHNG